MEDIENIVKYNVTVGVSDINFIRGLARTNKLVKVHIELETGMNRTGVLSKYLESFIDDIVKYPTVYVEGIYTHLSSADYDDEYTLKVQLKCGEQEDYILETIGCTTVCSNGTCNTIINNIITIIKGSCSYFFQFPINIYNTQSFTTTQRIILYLSHLLRHFYPF